MGITALVTGAGRRIGRAIALRLAREGTNVVVHYNRSAEGAREVVEEASRSGVEAWPFQADLSDVAGLDEAMGRAWETSGGLGLLVNSASVFPTGRLHEIEFGDVTRNMAVNAWAPFALTRSLWRRCSAEQRQGAVVNLLDSRLVGGDPLHAAYFLSKVALADLTRSSALEFAPVLRVNAVAPGPILPPEDKDEEYLSQQVEQLPLERSGGPDRVADAVVYLASADFVTGQTIFVDGGQHLRPGGKA